MLAALLRITSTCDRALLEFKLFRMLLFTPDNFTNPKPHQTERRVIIISNISDAHTRMASVGSLKQ